MFFFSDVEINLMFYSLYHPINKGFLKINNAEYYSKDLSSFDAS